MAPPRDSTPETSPDTSAAVDAFMAALDHPHKAAIIAVRETVLGVDPSIEEGVKWNVPSFRTREYFGTIHMRAKVGIGLILHLGARVRQDASVQIDDPDGLLVWLAPDRAVVHFASETDVRQRASALQAVVRQWIAFV